MVFLHILLLPMVYFDHWSKAYAIASTAINPKASSPIFLPHTDIGGRLRGCMLIQSHSFFSLMLSPPVLFMTAKKP